MSVEQRTVVHTYEEYQQALQSAQTPLFVYVIGTRDQDGNSWCPDCVKVDEAVRAQVAQRNAVLLEAQVPREGYKNCPDNAYRVDAQLKINSVPTLLLFASPSEVVARAQDDELLDEATYARFDVSGSD
ncbi:MAG: hypothetical protein MHM6MM_008686 [Cercozoa sp. M6MM]